MCFGLVLFYPPQREKLITIWGPKHRDKAQNFEMFAILCSSFCYLTYGMQEDFRINTTLLHWCTLVCIYAFHFLLSVTVLLKKTQLILHKKKDNEDTNIDFLFFIAELLTITSWQYLTLNICFSSLQKLELTAKWICYLCHNLKSNSKSLFQANVINYIILVILVIV